MEIILFVLVWLVVWLGLKLNKVLEELNFCKEKLSFLGELEEDYDWYEESE